MQTEPTRSGLVPLAILAVIGGAGAGLICGLFRVLLDWAAQLRAALPSIFAANPLQGFMLTVAGAAAAAAVAAFLVRRLSPESAGSGIPHVESVLAAEAPPAPFTLIPVKFIGGLLAMGAGLALGREGPCVQMGGTIAYFLGNQRDWPDRQALLAAGAGAGLAAAFNAPLAGAIFVLEELLRRFELRNAIAALGASMSAIVVARLFIGDAPDFSVAALPAPTSADNLLCLGLGLFAGVLGAVYSRVLLDALDIADGLKRMPVELRAGLVGAACGALAWFAPGLAGGGDSLTQAILNGAAPLALLPLLYAIRLFLSCASYAAGTPGGLFAPLIALGALMGFFFGTLCYPGEAAGGHTTLFALVGMAALFAATVRAPLTGMILVTEMTGNAIELLPMLAACFTATATATLLGSAPIYDSLKARAMRLSDGEAQAPPAEAEVTAKAR